MNTNKVKARTFKRYDALTDEYEFLKMVEYVDLTYVTGFSESLLQAIRERCQIYEIATPPYTRPALMIEIHSLIEIANTNNFKIHFQS